jgi:hypothetical protein
VCVCWEWYVLEDSCQNKIAKATNSKSWMVLWHALKSFHYCFNLSSNLFRQGRVS